MENKFGFEKLVEQATDAAEQRAAYMAAAWQADPRHTGDTPIEQLLYLALHMHIVFTEPTYFSRLETGLPESAPNWEGALYIRRQVSIENVGRVDFLVQHFAKWAMCPDGGQVGWRRLIVECDGHNFHERTKEQAAKDRGRDRAATLHGYEVFRFTGSELWRNPWGCASQIIQWAERGI